MSMTEEERRARKNERAKAYYQSRKDTDEYKRMIAEYRAKRKLEDPEAWNQYHRNYRRNNPEKCAEYARTYYQRNREKSIARSAKWRKEHPERVSEYNRRYRIKKDSQSSKITKSQKPCLDKIKSLFKNQSDAEKHFKWMMQRSQKESEVIMK